MAGFPLQCIEISDNDIVNLHLFESVWIHGKYWLKVIDKDPKRKINPIGTVDYTTTTLAVQVEI